MSRFFPSAWPGLDRRQDITAHTPTPWKVTEGHPGSGPWDRLVVETDEIVVCTINRQIEAGHANASFIVRAVNNHKEALEIIESLLGPELGSSERAMAFLSRVGGAGTS